MAERLVVVGGDAGGMGAISQARKGKPDLEVVAFERGRWTSYSACGIPYLVAGQVESIERLVSRRPDEFREAGVDVRMGHEVTAFDLDARQVEVHYDGRTYREGFDQLLVGTGGHPIRPDLPGIDLPLVHGVQTLDDAAALLLHAESAHASRVAIVGGGYIGLEMAEAFTMRGADVTLTEQAPQVMGTLDPDMAAIVQEALVRFGVEVHVGCEVKGFEDHAVITAAGRLEADLVVLGLGVAPNSALAEQAGIELGVRRAVRVDRRQATSADGVWAAGDCCESTHLVSGEKVHIALGTVANKQARVAGLNIGGRYATFPGVLGTAISKICATEVARTGLSTAEAERAGFASFAAVVETTTRAGYFPGSEAMTTKFVVEARTGRLLGAQIVGGSGSAKRIDACAVAITAGLSVDEVVDLDLAYAPPFSSVWDPVLVAARAALRQMEDDRR
jgi:NADPH-dependent 2,4-dienoyl-CoA reductase/sulfur reductase-like enzyme